MVSKTIYNELQRADQLRQTFERMLYAHGETELLDDRSRYLLAQWSLVVEHHHAIVSLTERELHGSAVALLRPIVEAVVRGHVVLYCPDDVLARILNDEYRTNFGTVGKEIDDHFGMGTLLQDFLRDTIKILHSYTHSGMRQVRRRFAGGSLQSNYPDLELIGLIRSSTSGLFMLTNILTKQLKYEDDWKSAGDLWLEYGVASPVS